MSPSFPAAPLIWSACRDGFLTAKTGDHAKASEIASALQRAGVYPDLPEEVAAVARAGARRIRAMIGTEQTGGGFAA